MDTRTTQHVDVYVFYFDVVGTVKAFLAEGVALLERLRQFQRCARREFPFSNEHSYVATLYDNVWARVNASQPGCPSLLLDYVGLVIAQAKSHGFPRYYACLTRGVHDYDPDDRMLIAGENWEDLKEQHIDTASEPHIRAAYAERWSRRLRIAPNTCWVSSEVLDRAPLHALNVFPDSAFEPSGQWFDLTAMPLPDGEIWPFAQSRFHAIVPRQVATEPELCVQHGPVAGGA